MFTNGIFLSQNNSQVYRYNHQGSGVKYTGKPIRLIPVEVLSEAGVSDTGGVVSEHVNSRVNDAHCHHLPVCRQN